MLDNKKIKTDKQQAMANLTYFKKFDTKGEYDTYIGGTPVLPNVSIVADKDVYFKDGEGPEPQHDYSQDYLTFKIISPGTIVWKAQNTGYTTTIEYSTDSGETWASITSNTGTSAPSISVEAGDVVQFRGNNATYATNTSRYNSFSGSTAKFEVEGNSMSLIYGTNFATATTLVSSYTFNHFFYNCTGLTSAENLVLPATTTVPNCYANMFQNCTSLTSAPSSIGTSAIMMAGGCCTFMFQGCTSLTSAPALPATTLGNICYQFMFYNCTSLTTAPELPATTLGTSCYDSMFQSCTNLTSAPELPATTLVDSCYSSMFYGCTNLNYIKCLATDISASNCTSNWVNGVASTGTFVKPSTADWGSKTGSNGIPNGWAVQDA